MTEWVVASTDVKKSKHLTYYKEVAQSIHFFASRFSWEYLLKVKKKTLYWDTISSVYPPPLYRSVSVGQGKDVFKRLRKLPVSPKTKQFFLRFHTETLPVKTWLRVKGFCLPLGVACSFCGGDETLEHVFLECKGAFCFWSDFRFVLQKDFEPDFVALKYLHFDCNSATEFQALVVMALHALWICRTLRVEAAIREMTAWELFYERVQWTLSLLAEWPAEAREAWEPLKEKVKRRLY